MNQLKDILAEKLTRATGLPTITGDMPTDEAQNVCKWIEHYARDIEFKMTDQSYDIVRAVFNSNIKTRRGVYVHGAPGIGKTYTFMALARYERAMMHPYPIMNVNVRTLEERYKIDGAEYFLDLVNYPRLALHNFGFQSDVFNDFGTKKNLILDLIDQRYDHYQRDEATRTFITSNFDGRYVNKFGRAISRRIQAMMNYISV